MASAIVNIFKIPELRRRVLFTLFILIVYRIGAHIPIPGINIEALKSYFDQAAKPGRRACRFLRSVCRRRAQAVYGLRAGDNAVYLRLYHHAASTVVIPQLERISKEGPEGHKKINQYTRYGDGITVRHPVSPLTFWMKSMSSAKAPSYPKTQE